MIYGRKKLKIDKMTFLNKKVELYLKFWSFQIKKLVSELYKNKNMQKNYVRVICLRVLIQANSN